jgi:hypothetical protein
MTPILATAPAIIGDQARTDPWAKADVSSIDVRRRPMANGREAIRNQQVAG